VQLNMFILDRKLSADLIDTWIFEWQLFNLLHPKCNPSHVWDWKKCRVKWKQNILFWLLFNGLSTVIDYDSSVSSKGGSASSAPLLKMVNIIGETQPPFEESVFLLPLITELDIITKGTLQVITLSSHFTMYQLILIQPIIAALIEGAIIL